MKFPTTKYSELEDLAELMVSKVERADLTCDVIKKVAPFVLSKL